MSLITGKDTQTLIITLWMHITKQTAIIQYILHMNNHISHNPEYISSNPNIMVKHNCLHEFSLTWANIMPISSLGHLSKSLLFPTALAEQLLSRSCHSKPLTVHRSPWSVAFCITLYGVSLFITL